MPKQRTPKPNRRYRVLLDVYNLDQLGDYLRRWPGITARYEEPGPMAPVFRFTGRFADLDAMAREAWTLRLAVNPDNPLALDALDLNDELVAPAHAPASP